jgi:SHS2 domain-containing protein
VIMYRWVEHTAEIELRIDAPTQEGVFADALDAFGELVGRDPAGEPARHHVVVDSEDRAVRLVEWLEELVFLAETEDFVPERLASLELDDGELRAEVEGRRGRPAHLVKAITYHGLAVEERPNGWHARVVLDV